MLYALASLSLIMTSCGGKSEKETSEKIKPETIEVSGDLEDCFTVVDREYAFVDEIIGAMVTVELERTDAELPIELQDADLILPFGSMTSGDFVCVGFGIEFLDADGNILDKVSANGSGLSGSYDPDEGIALVNLKSGRKGSIRFMCNDNDIVKKVTQFRITSAYEVHNGNGNTSSYYDSSNYGNYSSGDDDEDVDSYSASNNSSSNTDWDEILDDYERVMDRYISLAKRAQNGDMSVMSEYSDLMTEVSELDKKLSNASSELSASQIARLNKIAQKAAQAAY